MFHPQNLRGGAALRLPAVAELALCRHPLHEGPLAGVLAAQPPLRSVLLPNVPPARIVAVVDDEWRPGGFRQAKK